MTRPVPALAPPRPLTLPRDSRARLPNGLTVIVIRAATVPLVELRLRVPFGRRHRSPGHGAVQHPLLRHRHDVQCRHRGGAAGGGRRPGRRHRPGPVADLRQRPGHRAGPAAGDPRRRARPARRTPKPRWSPSGSGSPTGSRWRRRQPSHLARVALLRRIYPATRTSGRPRRPTRSARSTTTRCGAARRAGPPGRRRPWCSSATSTRRPPWLRWSAPSAAGTAAASRSSCRPRRR